jgi:hypothetical protein
MVSIQQHDNPRADRYKLLFAILVLMYSEGDCGATKMVKQIDVWPGLLRGRLGWLIGGHSLSTNYAQRAGQGGTRNGNRLHKQLQYTPSHTDLAHYPNVSQRRVVLRCGYRHHAHRN